MVSTVRQKLIAALEKIGNTNGHSCPESQDPAVPLQHEYFVATHGEAYFKKRREVAKKAIEKSLGPDATKKLDKAIASVRENEVPDTCTVLETDPYTTAVELKNGASFFDAQKLKIILAREHKMSMTQVEAIFEQCTTRREPSKSWKVTER